MIHWSWIFIILFAGFFLGFFIASALSANDPDDDFRPTELYRDKHGNLILDDGRHIQQYDPESGEWKTLN